VRLTDDAKFKRDGTPMNILVIAAISGFIAGEFTSNLLSEHMAHAYEGLYANGFYMLPPTPDLESQKASMVSEEAYLERLCRLSAADAAIQ